jgi:aspartyl-tRNA(Asn)/glutamyl-tRNA(Gln) amidotransferase subunit B
MKSTAATDYEVVIGLEVHAQVLTKSKMFCGCSADYLGAPPNTNTCPVCLGLPGSLPVVNREAVNATIKTGLSLNCEVASFTKFDRKNYFYPDLPKGYQISQYDAPLTHGGYLEFEVNGVPKRCRITRVHLEEDTGKLMHEGNIESSQSSLVDYNRAGVPLMEIVSEPDLRSADEAREYAMFLRTILQDIGVSNGDMESGQLRCDANVSLRPAGSSNYGTKVEIKNMNSFRAIHGAILYEIERQTQVLETGGQLVQETRGWNEARGLTVSQRSKEYAHDYRYFPEPDIPPFEISAGWKEEIRGSIPEFRSQWQSRFKSEFMALTPYDQSLIVSSKEMMDYFQGVVGFGVDPKEAANWMLGDLARLLNADKISIERSPVRPQHLYMLIQQVESGAITGRMGKDILDKMYSALKANEQQSVSLFFQGASQISDDTELIALVDEVIAANAKSVADFKAGKAQALKFLIGQAMKISKGRANPQRLEASLREKIK